MTPAAIHAVYAEDLNPRDAWAEVRQWQEAPAATLTGIDGAKVERGSVRALWNNEWVVFEFKFRDRSLVSPGKADGLDHFQMGDVAEIFLGREGVESYAEVHATPAGRMTLYFMSGYRVRSEAPPSASAIQVHAGPVRGGWRAVIGVPWKLLGGNPRGGRWNALAARYDYNEGSDAPVLSSFPAQSGKPDFHARERWAKLELEP